MLQLPAELLPLIVEFVPLFSRPVWEHVKILLVGAILATGTRTVTACVRGMRLSQAQCFVNYHRVLHRARWSPLAASQLLRRTSVTHFAPEGELVFGWDDTIERRRGDKLNAKGTPAIRDVLLSPILSKRVVGGGAVVWRWSRFRGLVLCGECLA